MSFVVARQPIFDRNGEVFAYEFFLRREGDEEKYPEDVPFSRAVYIITDILVESGIEKLANGKKAVINVSLEAILNKSLELLPPDKVIFDLNPPEVPLGETLKQKVLQKLKDYKGKGVSFILNERLYSSEHKELINLSDIVEFYFKSVTPDKIRSAKRYGKKVLVSMIEKEEEYKKALEYGADYFQGFYFAKPEIVKRTKLAPFLKVTLLRLLNAISIARSLKEIADIIETDVGLAVKFLQFVNSAYFARRKKIESLEHAVSFVGMENIKKFVILVSMNEFLKVENPELWRKSLTRAFIAEELTNRYSPEVSEKAFLVGLFSLLDKILEVDIPTFLRELNVDEEVVKAFEDKGSSLHKLLEVVSRLEEAVNSSPEELDKTAQQLSQELGIPEIDLVIVAKEAKEKAERIIKI
ncbi:EAL and HDOD domain-containing protein [Aquifex aeolicus]|uniref:HDOD domain-containing protein n=1 Tax=Aquifex aeolicus (strain VF5) TaxID=224324 RepID=O66775_AQUAE|nr:EAL and HDOD domain-containing protein [Aquifex aeolicus]AAC06749.1 hypothetical protein aq_478 [Aquifex aeolicus VF5]